MKAFAEEKAAVEVRNHACPRVKLEKNKQVKVRRHSVTEVVLNIVPLISHLPQT